MSTFQCLYLRGLANGSPRSVPVAEDKGYFARGGKNGEAEKVLLDAATEQAVWKVAVGKNLSVVLLRLSPVSLIATLNLRGMNLARSSGQSDPACC